jgi:siroheme decarboxylase
MAIHATKAGAPVASDSLRVLDRLQQHIPLVERPYRAVGEELGLDEEAVLRSVAELKEARLLRQLGVIFDAANLGYQSSLVAARYDPLAIDAAAEVISSHPGVSHNYRRDHDFNLWYTIAVPPGQSLEDVVALLHRLTGAESTRLLPTLKRYKLGVRLDLAGTGSAGERPPTSHSRSSQREAGPLTPREIAAVRALQDDLPVCPRPFDQVLTSNEFSTARDLLAVAQDLLDRGIMRRFAGVVRHREAGFHANGMVAWVASDEECDRVGPIMATFEKVSHCYRRPTYPDWPYSLFTMIHGRSRDEVEECICAIRAATGLTDYSTLYSTVEYKKRRVRYFTDAWRRWDEGHATEVPRQ